MIRNFLIFYCLLFLNKQPVVNAGAYADGCGALWITELNGEGFDGAILPLEFGTDPATLRDRLFAVAQFGLTDDGPDNEGELGELSFDIPATSDTAPEEGTLFEQDTTPTNFTLFAESFFIAPENGDYTFSIDSLSANSGAAWFIFDNADTYCCDDLDLLNYLPSAKSAYFIGNDPCNSTKSVTVQFQANHTYEIVLTYANTRGDAQLDVSVELPSGEKVTEMTSMFGFSVKSPWCGDNHQQFFNITKTDVPTSTTYSTSFSETTIVSAGFSVRQLYTYYQVYGPLTEPPSTSYSSSSSICTVSSSSSSFPSSSSSYISSLSSSSIAVSSSSSVPESTLSSHSTDSLSASEGPVSTITSVSSSSEFANTTISEKSSFSTSSDEASAEGTSRDTGHTVVESSSSVMSSSENSIQEVTTTVLSTVIDISSDLITYSRSQQLSSTYDGSEGPIFANSTMAGVSSTEDGVVSQSTVTYTDRFGVTITTTVPCEQTTTTTSKQKCTKCQDNKLSNGNGPLLFETTVTKHLTHDVSIVPAIATAEFPNLHEETITSNSLEVANYGTEKTVTSPSNFVKETTIAPATILFTQETENKASGNTKETFITLLCIFSLLALI